MKKLFTIIALTISFSMNAQLIPVTENGTTGQRLTYFQVKSIQSR